eukprot:4329293-Pleurochrysis_carterae.AAC.6
MISGGIVPERSLELLRAHPPSSITLSATREVQVTVTIHRAPCTGFSQSELQPPSWLRASEHAQVNRRQVERHLVAVEVPRITDETIAFHKIRVAEQKQLAQDSAESPHRSQTSSF